LTCSDESLVPRDREQSLDTVEGLNCKRPIQCLASSKILTPHPLTARRVCTTPPLVREDDTLVRWRGGGGGESIFSIFWKTPDTVLDSTYVSTLCLAPTHLQPIKLIDLIFSHVRAKLFLCYLLSLSAE
jgi:hypothetical protein